MLVNSKLQVRIYFVLLHNRDNNSLINNNFKRITLQLFITSWVYFPKKIRLDHLSIVIPGEISIRLLERKLPWCFGRHVKPLVPPK